MTLSTNAFTGAHILCLFFVVVWFIYRLKHEARLVKWISGVLSNLRAPSALVALQRKITFMRGDDRSRHYQRTVYLWVKTLLKRNDADWVREELLDLTVKCFGWITTSCLVAWSGRPQMDLYYAFDRPHVLWKQLPCLFSGVRRSVKAQTQKQTERW